MLRLLILSTLLLAACGQSGDLYLPEEAPPYTTSKPTPAPTPAPSPVASATPLPPS